MARGGSELMFGRGGRLTCDKNIFIGGSNELHGFLAEECHVLVDGVVGDVFVGAVVEGDEDVQEDCVIASLANEQPKTNIPLNPSI